MKPSYGGVRVRGDPSTITDPSGTRTLAYDITGNVTQTSVNGVTSTISTDSTTNYAAPSQMTTGSLSQTMAYNSFLGLTNETDQNGASVSLGYDVMARPSSSTSPFGATATTTYADTASPPTVTTTINGRWTRKTMDGLGRTILTETGDGSGTKSQTETIYDSCGCSPLGKMKQQAVTHAPGATPVYTTYTYDGIGRTVTVLAPDGISATNYLYRGNTVTATDPAGKWKKFTTDALGNLVQVNEPNPAGGADYVTTYAYDTLGHLTSVSMPRPTGTQTRTFVYSGNKLMSATNPENGTVTYTYNQYNKVATRTDAKNQQVVYTYDSYARLTKVQRYAHAGGSEDTCRQENYTYDTAQNGLGRLASVQYMGGNSPCDTTFTESYSYSPPGAVLSKTLGIARQTGSASLTATFAYDNEGRMTSEQYPSGYSYGYDPAVGYDDWHQTPGPNISYTYDTMGRLYTQ